MILCQVLWIFAADTHLQADLIDESRLADAKRHPTRGFILPTVNHVIALDRFLQAMEVIQRLSQPNGTLWAVETQVLCLNGERTNFKTKRRNRTFGVSGVVLHERRRRVCYFKTKRRIRDCREIGNGE